MQPESELVPQSTWQQCWSTSLLRSWSLLAMQPVTTRRPELSQGHIQLAVRNDEELSKLLGKVTICLWVECCPTSTLSSSPRRPPRLLLRSELSRASSKQHLVILITTSQPEANPCPLPFSTLAPLFRRSVTSDQNTEHPLHILFKRYRNSSQDCVPSQGRDETRRKVLASTFISMQLLSCILRLPLIHQHFTCLTTLSGRC